MGRDIGTNVYSNNFEPQVMGLLDARTRVDTKADLTKTATWTSADGNTYAPVGIRVSVTDDSTSGNNGVYMLMGEEYTIASNWMQINSSSDGGSGKTEKISIPFATIRDLAENANTTSSDIVAAIGQDNLDKLCNFYLPLDIEMPSLYGDGPMYARKNYMMGIPNNLAVYINTLENKMFVLHKINDVYKLSILPQIIFDSTIESSSNNAPQNKAVSNALKTKQDILKSGTNIKTINGESVLGSGNLQIAGGDSISSNIKVLTTTNLVDISRNAEVLLSSEDVSTLRSATSQDVFVYNGVVGNMTTTIPLAITFTQTPATALQMVISYAFVDRTYYIPVTVTNTSQKDTFFADIPKEMANGSGGGSPASNVKVLTTPNLLNVSRTSPINLSAADIAIIKGLSDGKDMLVYNGTIGTMHSYIPLSVMKAGIGKIFIYSITLVQASALYVFNINTNNLTTYSASTLAKIEGGGSGKTVPDLNLEVRISNNKIQCRVNEIVENGYICFYRKKRCGGSKINQPNRPNRNKYTIPGFYFVRNASRSLMSVISVGIMQPNVWKTINIPDLAAQYPTNIRFKGSVHAKPCELKTSTGTALNKKTAVLNLGLAYNVINPNFLNGVLENNSIPKDILRTGNMVKIKARLNCSDISNINSGYKIIYTMD